MKKIYVVAATHDTDGIVVLEVFEDENEALEFEKNENIRRLLRMTYGKNMARSFDEDRVGVSFHVRHMKG